MIHLLSGRRQLIDKPDICRTYLLAIGATSICFLYKQMQEMLNEFGNMIKIIVDIPQGLLAGGAEMRYGIEEVLLEEG